MIKSSKGEKIFDGFNVIIFIFVIIVTLYPMLYVLNASFSDPFVLMQGKYLLLLPEGFQLEAYKRVFENPMILIGYKNTLLYLVCGTTLSLFLTSLGAYALSRKNLYGKNFIMMMIAFTMFFGGGMVPTFLLVKNLHMVDTPFAMFVPIALSSWNLIIMRTSFQAMPESLIESAKIDGANDFVILFKLVLPLSLPIIAVMILYYGVGYWNDYMTPLLYLRAREKYPIQLVLRDILLSNSNNEAMTQGVASDSAFQIGENIKYATIIVSTLPILLVYPFIQKYFVQGVMIGAIKE